MKESTLTKSLNDLNDYLDGKDVPVEIHKRTYEVILNQTAKD